MGPSQYPIGKESRCSTVVKSAGFGPDFYQVPAPALRGSRNLCNQSHLMFLSLSFLDSKMGWWWYICQRFLWGLNELMHVKAVWGRAWSQLAIIIIIWQREQVSLAPESLLSWPSGKCSDCRGGEKIMSMCSWRAMPPCKLGHPES